MLPPRRQKRQRRVGSTHAPAVSAFPGFDERIHISSIDEHAPQRFSASLTFSGAQWWQVDDGDQSLEDVVPSGPETATEVRRGLAHIQQTWPNAFARLGLGTN